MIFFHEFTLSGTTDLLVGTEDAINNLMRFYKNEDYRLVTLWQVTDIKQIDTNKYSKIRLIKY